MKDEQEQLLERLFRAARTVKPDSAKVEEHFETRLMARVAERRERGALWSACAWRFLPWLASLVIVVAVAGFLVEPAAKSSDLFSSFTGDDEYQVTSLFFGE